MNEDLPALLKKTPTPEEHYLAEMVDRHDGDSVPFHMFAKVAIRQHRHGLLIGEMEALKRWIRRHARIGLVALATNLAAIGGYAVHRIASGAAAEERAVQAEQRASDRRNEMEREIQDLRLDVRELRAAMRRMSGSDPLPPDRSDGSTVDPDKFASMFGVSPSLLVSAAKAGQGPDLPGPQFPCGSPCSSNIECSTNRACPFCSFGSCKSTRPEAPVPADAGVDAPNDP